MAIKTPSEVVNASSAKLPQLLPASSEAIALLSGKDFWRTTDIPELGIGALKFSDGPNGARGENWTEGKAGVCFPCATSLGASFDRKLLYDVGKAIACESLAKRANGLLASTVNIHRYLLNGRNFESYSEDPHLSGHLAAEYIKGVQSENVAACPKHFLANEAENGRRWSDSVIEEQTLREIYLEPFRILIKESSPWCLMTSYNSCNGHYCSESEDLLQIVRKEWNFQGLIISDWFGTYSTVKALNAGLDLEMPGPSKFRTEEMINAAVQNGDIDQKRLATITKRIFKLLEQTGRLNILDPTDMRGELPEISSQPNEEAKALLRQAAADSMVLLVNKNGALPLAPGPQRNDIAIIGQHAVEPSIFGGGSASLTTSYISRPLEALLEDFPHAKFSEGVSVQRLVALASLLRVPGSEIQLDWYNSPEPDEAQLFRSENIPQSQYMMMEDIHSGLIDTQNFSTRMTITVQPKKTGRYRLSLTAPGEQTCYLDGVKVADVRRGSEIVTEDYIFNQANLEVSFDLPAQLEASKTYTFRIDSKSSKHSPVHINREFYVQGGRFGLAIIPNEDENIKSAQTLAANSSASIVFVGTSTQWESEGFDRVSFQLPGKQNQLISEVARASNGPTIVVINAGSPVDVTAWIDQVDAVIQVWFPGQECGNAIADLIAGRVSPSARLPTTIPRSLEDTAAGDLSAVTNTPIDVEKKIVYTEGLRVGYRAYTSTKNNFIKSSWYNPLFSFGHGLSFTHFSYNELENVTLVESTNDILVKVSVTVRNKGSTQGKEVVQAYVQALDSQTERPEVEMKAFSKSKCLLPNESERIDLLLHKEAFSFWDVEERCWKVEAGTYRVLFAGTRGVGDWIDVGDEALDICIKRGFLWSG